MLKRIKFSIEDYIAFIFIVLLLGQTMLNPNTDINTDWHFLYNRVEQVKNCLSDGNLPFFFYNDFLGAGYGSSFFYGYYPLYLFVPFYSLGYNSFVALYILVCFVLIYVGCCFFAKRFTDSYKYISLLFLGSIYAMYYYSDVGCGANHLAFGISLFFLGKCIDFFRDSKSFVPASVLFWLILNTHLITALLCFIGCVVIMFCYFKRSEFINYVKFGLFTCLICSYYILNFFYHMDGINIDTDRINKRMIDYHLSDDELANVCYLSYSLFGGSLVQIIASYTPIKLGSGLKLLSYAVAVPLFYNLYKRLKSKGVSRKEIFTLVIMLIVTVLGIRQIWLWWDSYVLIPIQFPIRYMPYFVLLLLIIGFKDYNNTKSKKFMLICCTIDLLLVGGFIEQIVDNEWSTEIHNIQVMSGEYLDKDFEWNTDKFDYRVSHIIDSNGKDDYSVIRRNDMVAVYVDTEDKLTLQFPKLYYKGYQCYKVDKFEDSVFLHNYALEDKATGDLECYKGESQFINVDVENFKGYLVLRYVHPKWLIILDFTTLGVVIISVFMKLLKLNVRRSD